MATLKARETLHLPANAKPRKLGKLVARARLKGNKKRNKASVKPTKLSDETVVHLPTLYGVDLSLVVDYPIK